MLKIKIYLVSFLLFFGAVVQAQKTALEVLEKASEKYNKETYVSYSSTYKLFLDYTTQKVHEQYTGRVLRKNNTTYVKIKETEFLTFDDCVLKINHDQKALIYQKKEDANEEVPFSLSGYLKGFQVAFGEQSKDYYICEIKPPKISQIMMSKAIVYIRKSDLSLQKQKIYFVEKMESKDSNGKIILTTPRLEIEYLEKPKKNEEDDFLVTKSNYVKESRNELQFSKRLATYKLYKI